MPVDPSTLEARTEALVACANARERDQVLLDAASDATAACVWRRWRSSHDADWVWRPFLSRGPWAALPEDGVVRAVLVGETSFALPHDARVLAAGNVALVLTNVRELDCDLLESLLFVASLLEQKPAGGPPHGALPDDERPPTA